MGMKTRYSGGRIANDISPKTVFANDVMRFRLGNNILDFKEYCEDYSEASFSEEDIALTRSLREHSKAWSHYFDMASLTQKPMYTKEDGAALLLPLDNELGVDYLTFRDEKYRDVIIDLVTLIDREFHNQETLDAASLLLTDYTMNNPFASIIRQDGRMVISVWPESAKVAFRKKLTELFLQSLHEVSAVGVENFRPSLNITKSVGFNNHEVNGGLYDKKKHYFFVGSEFSNGLPDEEGNVWKRYNNAEFKLSWFRNGAPLDAFEFLLKEGATLRDPECLAKQFEQEHVSVHKEAYRYNNPDGGKIETGFSDLLHLMCDPSTFPKDRDAAQEIPGYRFGAGTIKNERYQVDLWNANKGSWGYKNKLRPMFPAPNVILGPGAITAIRFLMKPIEDSRIGFPSLNEESQKHLDAIYAKAKELNADVTVVTFDRRTSEQFCTDNFSQVIELLPDALKSFFTGLCTGVLPSTYGARAVAGCLLSGTAPTTLINAVVGMFEMSLCIHTILKALGQNIRCESVVQLFMDQLIKREDFLTFDINGRECMIASQLGTDDQICFVAIKNLSSDEVTKILNKPLNKYFDERWLKGSVGEPCTVFGLHFTNSWWNQSTVLGLGKLFLFEKTKIGDQIAFKYANRLRLLPDFAPLVQQVFTKHSLGSISTYERGEESYKKFLFNSGFPVNEEFDDYSAFGKIVKSQFFLKNSIDPVSTETRFPLDFVQKIFSSLCAQFHT